MTLPHHKMLQPWAFNVHKECYTPFNNQSYHIFDEHLLTEITWLLRNRTREKHNNCVWSHNLPFCPFCLPFSNFICYHLFCFVLIQNNVTLVSNMFFHAYDAMGRLIEKNFPTFIVLLVLNVCLVGWNMTKFILQRIWIYTTTQGSLRMKRVEARKVWSGGC